MTKPVNGARIAEFVEAECDAASYFALAREAGGRMTRVSQAEITSETTPTTIAHRFWSRAEEFVGESGNQERFLVIAMGENNDVREQLPFRIGAADEAFASLAQADEPTSRGEIKATMRHLVHRETSNRKLMSELHQAMRMQIASLTARNETLALENSNYIDKHWKLITALEQAQSLAHERALKQADAEMQVRKTEWLMEKIGDLVPIFISKVTGAEPVGEFVESLDIDKLKVLMPSLEEGQREALEHILQTYKAAKEAKTRLATGA